MSFAREALAAAIARHGRVARVLLADLSGSSPRETGAAMLVWDSGQSGSIGGGALEFEATRRARAALAGGGDRLDREPLGPTLGQCCGGAVTLLTEVWDAARLGAFEGDAIVRPLPGVTGEMPLTLRRKLRRVRDSGAAMPLTIAGGWIAEPVTRPARALWVWGAGHVGRAIVATIAPLPGIAVTWIDTGAERFPQPVPEGVVPRIAPNPAEIVAQAPENAEHLVLTYSHALDLEICHGLLRHGFLSCGLIGSKTKWARFRARLEALGHAPASIARIRCPIGDPSLGKHPQAIAIGVAHDLLAGDSLADTRTRSPRNAMSTRAE